jgi:hypothetical protein
MIRQNALWTTIGATCLCLMAAASPADDVVRTNLHVWLDASDHNADGVQEVGAGTTWRNKADSGVMHDATLAAGGDGPAPAWSGNGTVASPYAVQFRFAGRNSGGYAAVANSTGGADLDTPVYSYEGWGRRNGVGGNGSAQHGALIAHCAPQGWGVGGLNYTHGVCAPMAAQVLFAEGGNPAVDAPLPNSTGVFTTTGYHHFVLTRAGDGAKDSAFYLDGVLQGQFETASTNASTGTSPLTVGGRVSSASEAADYFLDCDIAVVRIYTAAISAAEAAQNFSAQAARFGLAAVVERRARCVGGTVADVARGGTMIPLFSGIRGPCGHNNNQVGR